MLLLIEAFYAGSHKQLISTLVDGLGLTADDVHLVTMSGKKWHWRARTSALHLSQLVPRDLRFSVLWTSSVTPLAELLGLRPDLGAARKLLYFHENQLVYPLQHAAGRGDFQYGYNQITSCLVADRVLFNSHYNMHSFLEHVDGFLRRQPDYKSRGVADTIRPKCEVLYFPLQIPASVSAAAAAQRCAGGPLHILWPHRWEHDKDPDMFFEAMQRLHAHGVDFQLSVVGQSFSECPPVFAQARQTLSAHVAHWGFEPCRRQYWTLLQTADVVVSTARHEFFGVAVLEAVAAGCWPLCVGRLVYPELFPARQLFSTVAQLVKRLRRMCRRPQLVRDCTQQRVALRVTALRFSWQQLQGRYRQLLVPESTQLPRSPPPTESTQLPQSPPPTHSTQVPRSPPPTESTQLPRSPPPTESAQLPRSPPTTESTQVPGSPPPTQSTQVPPSPPPTELTQLPRSPPPTESTQLPRSPPPTESTLLPRSPPPTESTAERVHPSTTESTTDRVHPTTTESTTDRVHRRTSQPKYRRVHRCRPSPSN